MNRQATLARGIRQLQAMRDNVAQAMNDVGDIRARFADGALTEREAVILLFECHLAHARTSVELYDREIQFMRTLG